jgi:hypothetical protein
MELTQLLVHLVGSAIILSIFGSWLYVFMRDNVEINSGRVWREEDDSDH